jgi:hypothetical protein
MKVEIKYVDKSEIFPSFAFWNPGVIKIRNDVPDYAQRALVIHETQHEEDKDTRLYWIRKELRANIKMLFAEPRGFFWILYKTIFSWERIKYYIKRFKEGR